MTAKFGVFGSEDRDMLSLVCMLVRMMTNPCVIQLPITTLKTV